MALIGVHGLQSGAAACLQHLLCLLPGVAAQALLPLLPVALSIHIDADMTLHIPVDGVVCQMLNGIQGIAPAADEVAQIVTHQIHLVGVGGILPAVGNSLGVHVLQQTLQKLLNLLLGGAGRCRLIGLGCGRLLLGLGLSGSLGRFGLSLRLVLCPGSLGLTLGLGLGLGLGCLGLGCLGLGSFGLGFRLLGRSLGLGTGSGAEGYLGSLGDGIGSLIGHLHFGRLGADAQKTGLGLLQNLNGNAVPIHAQLLQGGFNGKVNGLAAGDNGLFHFYSSVGWES